MLNEANSDLRRRIRHNQIMNTLQHQSLMLFALIGLTLLTYLTYRGAVFGNDRQLSGWTILSISAIAISAVINTQLGQRANQVSLELIDSYLLFNAFMLGLIIAVGQLLFGLNLSSLASLGSQPSYGAQLFGAIVIFSHMLALISLTDRLRYFLMFIITSMIPVLTIQLVGWRDILPSQSMLFFADLYFVFMLFCGHQLHRIRDE